MLLLVEADGLGPDPLMAWSERLDDSLMAPFGRLEPGLALESGGDALDLYVAARLMAEQGGDVWTATRPEGGAVLRRTTAGVSCRPTHPGQTDRAGRRRAADGGWAATMTAATLTRILLVEDHQLVGQGLQTALEMNGFDVVRSECATADGHPPRGGRVPARGWCCSTSSWARPATAGT